MWAGRVMPYMHHPSRSSKHSTNSPKNNWQSLKNDHVFNSLSKLPKEASVRFQPWHLLKIAEIQSKIKKSNLHSKRQSSLRVVRRIRASSASSAFVGETTPTIIQRITVGRLSLFISRIWSFSTALYLVSKWPYWAWMPFPLPMPTFTAS